MVHSPERENKKINKRLREKFRPFYGEAEDDDYETQFELIH